MRDARSSASHRTERIAVAHLADGRELDLAVHRVRGSEDGPCLILLGGVHGDEPSGVEIVRRSVQTVSGLDFRGEVIAIPVCNPLALYALNRNTPLDGGNLNRVLPGDPAGTITDQIAVALAGFLSRSGGTHLIDLHSGGNQATVDYAYLDPEAVEFSASFGTPLLYDHVPYTGTTADVAKAAGMRVMTSELGGGGQRLPYYLDRGVTGVTNVMRHLDMLDGEPEPPVAPQRVAHEITKLGPRHGGVLISEVGADQLGSSVEGGSVLGRVHDPASFELLEELRAPYQESIMVLAREPMTVVAPGDYAFMVADGASTVPLDVTAGR